MMTVYSLPQINAISQGCIAHEILASGAPTKIIGSTSRGLFMLASAREVIFLSYETWRSPITVNLGRVYAKLRQAEAGAAVQLSELAITIPSLKVAIDLSRAPVWAAQEVPPVRTSSLQRISILQETAAWVTAGSQVGWSRILAALLEMPETAVMNQDEQAILDRLIRLKSALFGDSDAALQTSTSLLGCGRGLTPSGDDLITGLLLAIRRWSHAIPESPHLHTLVEDLPSYGYAQTTSLSASIIAAAALGQADERLLLSLDAFFTAERSPQQIADLLLNYGGSSGLDALTGFALALTLSKE
jgi:hypothetical protein